MTTTSEAVVAEVLVRASVLEVAMASAAESGLPVEDVLAAALERGVAAIASRVGAEG